MLKKNVNKDEKKKIKPLIEIEYFTFLGVVFFLCGIMLTVYCIVLGYNVLDVPVFQNPLFFLGLGISCMITALCIRSYK